MPPPAIADCDPRCADSLGVQPGTGKSEKCYGCKLKAKTSAAPKRSIGVPPNNKKKRVLTNSH